MSHKELKELRSRLVQEAIAKADSCIECVSAENSVQVALSAVAEWTVSDAAWPLDHSQVGYVVQTAVAVIKTHYETQEQEQG